MNEETGHCSSECHHLKTLELLLDEKERSLLELKLQLNDVQEKCELYKKDCEELNLELQAQKLDLRDRLRVSRDAQSQTPIVECKLVENTDAHTQTFETDFSYVESANSVLDWQPTEGSQLTVADIVKDAAFSAAQSDYVYDEGSGTYYNTVTGYYYDPYKQLFYEPHTKIYYSFDEELKTYIFHSKLEELNEKTSSKPKKSSRASRHRSRDRSRDENRETKHKSHKKSKKHKKKSDRESPKRSKKKRSKRRVSESEPEDGEISSEESIILIESDNDCVIVENDPDLYPPSMRLIVQTSEKLNIGSLLLVTYKGGIVGKTEQFEVCIPDTGISRSHAKIDYDELTKVYTVADLGSQNGTYINAKRLSEPKLQSDACKIGHGDTLAFGSCVLKVHIHTGHNTCVDCEPGLLQAVKDNKLNGEDATTSVVILTKAEREEERKKQMKLMKKRYGLESSDYETSKNCQIEKIGYKDRAQYRRKTVGSSNPYEKDGEAATVDKPIEINNKGYKMLEKLGWSKGQGLGSASSNGILEPINPSVQFGRGGLGINDNKTVMTSSSTTIVGLPTVNGDKRNDTKGIEIQIE